MCLQITAHQVCPTVLGVDLFVCCSYHAACSCPRCALPSDCYELRNREQLDKVCFKPYRSLVSCSLCTRAVSLFCMFGPIFLALTYVLPFNASMIDPVLDRLLPDRLVYDLPLFCLHCASHNMFQAKTCRIEYAPHCHVRGTWRYKNWNGPALRADLPQHSLRTTRSPHGRRKQQHRRKGKGQRQKEKEETRKEATPNCNSQRRPRAVNGLFASFASDGHLIASRLTMCGHTLALSACR